MAGPVTADVFSVSTEVDVTGATAAAARETALAEGQRLALKMLLERLTLERDRARLPTVADSKLLDMIRGYEIADEKTSSVRYLATLTVSFKPDDVRTLLRAAAIPFAETLSKPMLVVPIFEQAGGLTLWDEPNPWRAAWAGLALPDGPVRIELPLGDLADANTLGPIQAAQGDSAALMMLARRYNTAAVLVAVAKLQENGGAPNPPSLELTLSRYGSSLGDATVIDSIPAAPGQALDDLLTAAARRTIGQIEEDWKTQNLLGLGKNETVAIAVPLGKLADWVDIRRRLSDVGFLEKFDLVSLSRKEAQIALRFAAQPEQLRLALEQSDLLLVRTGDGWTLRRRETAPAGETAP